MSNELARPSYLEKYSAELKSGLAPSVQTYIRPSYLRVVNAKSKVKTDHPELNLQDLDVFSKSGNLVEAVLRKGEKLEVIPVFHWVTYQEWYAYNQGIPNPVKDQTNDPMHPLAVAAKDPKNWKLEFENPEVISPKTGKPALFKYRRQLNFVLYCPSKKESFIATFAGGEAVHGETFGRVIEKKMGLGYPIFAQVFDLKTSTHYNKTRSENWPGMDLDFVYLASEEVAAEAYAVCKKATEAYEAMQLAGDNEIEGPEADTDNTAMRNEF